MQEESKKMNTHKILLVEDDAEISEMLTNYLSTENYEIACAVEVMQYIRKSSVVPVIIISAKDTEADKTLGLGLGADDYITKPFSNNPPIAAPVILTAGDLVMNLSDYTVTERGTPVELKAKEFDKWCSIAKQKKRTDH